MTTEARKAKDPAMSITYNTLAVVMWKGVRLERNLPGAGLLSSVVTQEVQLNECAFKGRAGRFRCCDIQISVIVIEPYSVKRGRVRVLLYVRQLNFKYKLKSTRTKTKTRMGSSDDLKNDSG